MHDTISNLHKIRQRTLVMGDDCDPICSMTATRALVDGLPKSRAEIFADASHFFLIEQPETFNRLLTEWLAS